jgi:hypothetical protein
MRLKIKDWMGKMRSSKITARGRFGKLFTFFPKQMGKYFFEVGMFFPVTSGKTTCYFRDGVQVDLKSKIELSKD